MTSKDFSTFLLLLAIIFGSFGQHFANAETTREPKNGYSVAFDSYTIDSSDPSGAYVQIDYDEYIEIAVWIENTSPADTEPRSFFLLLSLTDQDGEIAFYLPPAETPVLQPLTDDFGQIGGIIYTMYVPAFLEPGLYDLNLSVWDGIDENADDLLGAMIPNPDTGDPYLSVENLPAMDIIDQPMPGNPYSVFQYDVLGLHEYMPNRVKNTNLSDLASFHTGDRSLMATNRNTNETYEITAEDGNLIIVLHGWMPPYGSTSPPYGEHSEKWTKILENINDKVDFDNWSIVEYDWFNDALTPLTEASLFRKVVTPVRKDGVVTMDTTLVEEISFLDKDDRWLGDFLLYAFWYLMPDVNKYTAQKIPANAAMRGYQHGLMIARKLKEQVGLHNLNNVQIIAHSAGSWAALSLSAYLNEAIGANNPWFNSQVIYLDPFIPGNMSHYSPSYLSNDELELAADFTTTNPARLGAQAYYATGGKTAAFGGANSTIPGWTWSADEGLIVNNDDYEVDGVDEHDWPIYYYANSIEEFPFVLPPYGWWHSLSRKFDLQVELKPSFFNIYTAGFTLYNLGWRLKDHPLYSDWMVGGDAIDGLNEGDDYTIEFREPTLAILTKPDDITFTFDGGTLYFTGDYEFDNEEYLQFMWEIFDFGETTLDVPRSETIRMTNTGNIAFDFNADVFIGDNYSITSNNSFTLNPGEFEDIEVTFQPQYYGSHIPDALTITDNSKGNIVGMVELFGSGVSAPMGSSELTFTPGVIEFDEVNYGGTSVVKDLILANTGDETISGTVFLQHGDHFMIVDGGGSFTLAPGDNKTISVICSPDHVGDIADFLIADGDTASAFAELRATGIVPIPLRNYALFLTIGLMTFYVLFQIRRRRQKSIAH